MYSYFGMQIALFLTMSLFKIFFQVYFFYLFLSLFNYSAIEASKKKVHSVLKKQKLFLQNNKTLNLGTLSLNLKRLNKVQIYKIAVYLSCSSKATKNEVLSQKFFFKELIAYMLYSFSEKELNTNSILKQNYLKNLNLFVNQGSIKTIKIQKIKI